MTYASVSAARTELAELLVRVEDLREYIASEEARCRRAAFRPNSQPCDWCGATEMTVAEIRQWVPTGRYVCRWNGPCRTAWLGGIEPGQQLVTQS